MKRLLKIKQFVAFTLVQLLLIGNSLAGQSCMGTDLYEQTRESRRLNELVLANNSLLTLQGQSGTQCLGGDNNFQCVNYDIKIDNELYNTSQDVANEILSLVSKREIHKICTAKLLGLAQTGDDIVESGGAVGTNKNLKAQLLSYICTMATLLEDVSTLFDEKDAAERSIVNLENEIANLNAAIERKEEMIKAHEKKMNDIVKIIGKPGLSTEGGSGLLGDLADYQKKLEEAKEALEAAQAALSACQNPPAPPAGESGGEGEPQEAPDCSSEQAAVTSAEEDVKEAEDKVKDTATLLIAAMIELTGEETYAVLAMLQGTLFGQLSVGEDTQHVNFQVDGESFQLVDIGSAITQHFGVPAGTAGNFEAGAHPGVKDTTPQEAALTFLANLAGNLADDDKSDYWSLENANFLYGVSGCNGGGDTVCNASEMDSHSNYFIDQEYGFDMSDFYNRSTQNILDGVMSLTGNVASDASNIGTIAYAASLQAQQGRAEIIGDKDNPEKGTLYASIKDDQDEISRLESGLNSKEDIEQNILELEAQIKDQLCILNATHDVYKKQYKDMEFSNVVPETNTISLEVGESESENNPASFKEFYSPETKYLYTYVNNFSLKPLKRYLGSGYLGNYNGQLPREISAEFNCVIQTDDPISCKEKYTAIANSNQSSGSCSYTGTVAGPAPPEFYGKECKKSESGKKKQFGIYVFTCNCY